ncbi:hypothetical protein [Halobellus ruber]|uniref:Uncharacterized protein n=1 Tax=Halobellus ruber TaxID=2761102 RepID=A0A7J9SG43_9EURY|nr:hypothetical protein [Halobellus ruber]MBB6645688.1 hypothetical protein [Halobellus ruber]
MPSTDVDPPQDARVVAQQYLRYERPLTGLVVVVLTLAFLGAYLATSLVPAVAVGAGLLVVVRAPLLSPSGTVRLETDDDPGAVVDAFTGPTPPVLAFQWGIADDISVGEEGVTYRISYLFGLRSVEMTVQARTGAADDGRTVELEVAANGQPWSTYTVDVFPRDGGTAVEYEYTADRRFGLRRLPQRFVVRRYRDEALAAQGYTVVSRDGNLGM